MGQKKPSVRPPPPVRPPGNPPPGVPWGGTGGPETILVDDFGAMPRVERLLRVGQDVHCGGLARVQCGM